MSTDAMTYLLIYLLIFFALSQKNLQGDRCCRLPAPTPMSNRYCCTSIDIHVYYKIIAGEFYRIVAARETPANTNPLAVTIPRSPKL